ncbi:MAG: NfeD family protein [Rhodobiaceae bacterium]|nr:NfeD family protein [Rhodobiaceae bacterium]
MQEFFTSWGSWTWLILAVALAALEMVVPGILLIWLAGAAMVVALIDLLLPLDWQAEVALFAVLSVLFAYAGYRWSNQPGQQASDKPNLNMRGQSYVGRTFVVAEAIQNGRGKVKVGDTLWAVSGSDAEVGQSVQVTGVDGTMLVVEPV